ncbi:MAG: DUF58 domain-containing protein [Clostridia bacterium]|nr:DUF58 domain-containing protein [Clostridia bacterium]
MTIIVFIILIGILTTIELRIYMKHALRKLDIDVHFSQEVANFGDTIDVVEIAQNNKRLPLPFLILKFETPLAIKFLDMTNVTITDNFYREDMLTMGAHSRHTRKIKVNCQARGFYTFPRVNASTSDLLLIKKMGKDFTPNSSITILPKIISNKELQPLMSVTFSETTARRTLLTDPFSFAGIREYQPTDPMRSINWTASAKAGDFMVNTNTSTSDRHINLFLNLDFYNTKKSDALLEKSISLAYSYMMELCNQGISVSFFSNGKDIVSGSPVSDMSDSASSGSTSIGQRGIELARIDLKKPASSMTELLEEYCLKNFSDNLNVIISANYDEKFRASLSKLITNGKRILWIMPCSNSDKLSSKMEPEADIAPYFHRWEVVGRD